jgi:hypothetical protein
MCSARDPREHCYDIATHSRLGGQHGEEAKDEDEDGGEKDCAQDQAQKEEGLEQRSLTVFDFDECR